MQLVTPRSSWFVIILCSLAAPLIFGAHASAKTLQVDGKAVPLAQDGIHDPENDAITVLQDPLEAMKAFPRDNKGIVDWTKTLKDGHIVPRANILGTARLKPLDKDVILKNTGNMPPVKFSHRIHTEHMVCGDCHPKLFKEKQGATDISMKNILRGKQCGVCHGKVSFPPTKNCYRCHSVTKK